MEAGRRLVLAAMLVDTVGSGLVLPFELLFGTQLVGLSLPQTGFGLSIGTGLAIAAGPISGGLVDRFGPVRIVVVANALALGAVVGLLAIHGFIPFLVVTLVFAIAARTFWAAYSPLVAAFVEPGDLEAWFGRFRGARYVGLATGSAAAGLALLAGRESGLRLVLLADGASYAVAIGLYLVAAPKWMPVASPSPPRDVGAKVSGYRAALSDGTNVTLAALNVLDTLLIVMPLFALPVFVLDQLHLPLWAPGVLAATGTLAVAISMFFAGRFNRGRPRIVLLATAAALWSVGGLSMATGAALPGIAIALLPVAMILFGVGEALYAPIADAIPIVLAPANLGGRYSALHQLGWGISGTIAPALTAALLALGSSAVWLGLSATAALTAAGYLLLERRVGARVGAAGTAA